GDAGRAGCLGEPGPATAEATHPVDHDLVLRPELVARPQEHLHPRDPGAVDRGGGEVGVVGAGTVGSFGAHVVSAGSAAVVVVGLDVPRGLGEPVPVGQVMDDVVPVEQVRDHGVPVVLCVL